MPYSSLDGPSFALNEADSALDGPSFALDEADSALDGLGFALDEADSALDGPGFALIMRFKNWYCLYKAMTFALKEL